MTKKSQEKTIKVRTSKDTFSGLMTRKNLFPREEEMVGLELNTILDEQTGLDTR